MAMAQAQPSDVLSVRDAAKKIGVHYVTLYWWIQAQDIVYITFGSNIFIPFLEVERLKKERAYLNKGVAGEVDGASGS